MFGFLRIALTPHKNQEEKDREEEKQAGATPPPSSPQRHPLPPPDSRKVLFRHTSCESMQKGRGLFISMLDRFQNVTLVIDAPDDFMAEAFVPVENGDLDPAGLNFICRYLLKVKHSDKECDSFFPGEDQARYLLMQGDRCEDVKLMPGSRGLFLLDPIEDKIRRIWVSGIPTEVAFEVRGGKRMLEANIFTTPMLPVELGWLWEVAEKNNPCRDLGDLRVFMISPDFDLEPADLARFGSESDRLPRRRSIGVIMRSNLRRHNLFTAAGHSVEGCRYKPTPVWDHVILFQGKYVLIDTAQPEAVCMSTVLHMMDRAASSPSPAASGPPAAPEIRICDMVIKVLTRGTTSNNLQCFLFSHDPDTIGSFTLENALDAVRRKKVTVLLLEDMDPAVYQPWVRRRHAKYLFVLGQDAFPFLGTEPVEHFLRWKQHASTWAHVLIDKCKRCRQPCGLWALACPVCFGTMCYECVPGARPEKHAAGMCATCRVGRILFPKRRMLVDCNEHDVRALSSIAYRQTSSFACDNCGKAPPRNTYCSDACRERVAEKRRRAALGELPKPYAATRCEACELARRTYACDCLEHPHYCSLECARAHRPVHGPFCTNRPVEAWDEDLRYDVRRLSLWARQMVLGVLPRDKKKKSVREVEDI